MRACMRTARARYPGRAANGARASRQGTAKRWDQVAAYVRTRTVDEVLDMIKHGLRAGKFAPRQDSFAVAKKRQARAPRSVTGGRRCGSMSYLRRTGRAACAGC